MNKKIISETGLYDDINVDEIIHVKELPSKGIRLNKYYQDSTGGIYTYIMDNWLLLEDASRINHVKRELEEKHREYDTVTVHDLYENLNIILEEDAGEYYTLRKTDSVIINNNGETTTLILKKEKGLTEEELLKL